MDQDKIIGLALGLYVLAAVIPAALTQFFGADTTGWDAGTVALWGLIPLIAVIVLVKKLSKSDAA